MQNTKTNPKIDLSEFFNPDNISSLFNMFPKLISKPTKNSNKKTLSAKFYVDKFEFYQMLLEKIKSYFEINESFIISKSISIILKDVKSIIDNTNRLKEIQKIQFANTSNHIMQRSISKDFNRLKRNLSTKSNGKHNINERIKRKAYNTLFENSKEKNLCNINNVYLPLNENKEPKIKMVHFMNEAALNHSKNKNQKSTMNKGKSNLKKTKNIKALNINALSKNSSNLNTTKDYSTTSRRPSISKTETSSPIRNKSNGIISKDKADESPEHRTSPNLTKYKIQKKIIYDDMNKLNEPTNNIEDKNFDIFVLSNKVGKENVLPLIGNYIFSKYNFNEFMDLTKFRNWCEKISKGYINTNYYHNCLHASDVAHTCYIYFKEGAVNDKIGLNKKSICAVFLSSFCHDFKHPGFNNNYLIETKHPLSFKYNDISVLENMHISETFKIINEDINCNIFENMENSDYKLFRKQMISCVLGTDMSNHNNSLNFMKKCLKEGYTKTQEDEQNFMNLMVHTADISNTTKKFDVYYKWAKLVVEEFYYQGDKEKELGLKCSCDRNKVTLYKSQLGFIDYIIKPFFGDFIKVFPKLSYLYDNAEENRKKIKQMEEDDAKNKN